MQSVFCERLDGFGFASREPHGVSSRLFPEQIKRAPTSGTPSIWRREEDDLRLYGLGCSRFFARGSMASASPRANLTEFLQISSLRHEKSPPRAGNSVAQRRGFEPPDESPPSHDFQSCSLNHSDISAKPCNHIIFPQKRQLILRAFRQKVFGNFLFSSLHAARRQKRGKHALKRVKSCKKAEEFDIRLCRCVLLCYKKWEERPMKKEIFPHLLTAPFPWCKIEGRGTQALPADKF